MVKVIVDRNLFGRALKFLSILRDDVKFVVEGGELKTKAIEIGRVAYGEVVLKAESNVDSFEFATNITRLGDAVGKMKGDEKITIEKKEGHIVVKCGKVIYRIADYADVNDVPPINLEYKSRYRMNGNEFKEIIGLVSKVDDVVEFGRAISATGDFETLKIDVEGEVEEGDEAKYSMEFLNMLAKRVDKDDDVLVEFGKNKPVKITLSGEGYKFVYVLAPRVD